MQKNIFILLFLTIFLISFDVKNTTIPSVEEQQLDQLTVHFIDSGQGNAALLQFTDEAKDYTILYDVGDWQGNEVTAYLQNENISTIDLIIISHPHADHMGQLD